MASSFRLCPKCRAYNTIHVLRCYKCAADLPRMVPNAGSLTEDRKYSAKQSESRQAERSPLGVIGAVVELNGEIRHDILIENISVGGLLCHSDWNYVPHDRFGVLIPLEDEHYVLDVCVRRCETVRFSQWPYTIGVEFQNPSPELLRHIERLCRTTEFGIEYT